MKNLSYILVVLCLACSSSDDSNNNNNLSTFETTITQSNTTVTINQIVTVTATTNETINDISVSTDGGTTFGTEYSTNFGTTANLYLDFDTVGSKSVVFRLKNNDGEISDHTINVNVELGNAVKIQSLQLNSFYNMGTTWDDEFSDTNPQRLADVYFALSKPKLNIFTGTRSGVPSFWYKSQTRENETNLNWDLQNENLYINLDEISPYITFVDDDGGNFVQDLMLGPPFDRVIPLQNYINSQPNTVNIEELDINLQYDLSLSW